MRDHAQAVGPIPPDLDGNLRLVVSVEIVDDNQSPEHGDDTEGDPVLSRNRNPLGQELPAAAPDADVRLSRVPTPPSA